jgi:TRAP transporter 4TM/12TM fusion protein
MAVMPTILYYLSIFLMVEFDAKKFGAKLVSIDETYSLKQLTKLYWFHFTSLIAIVVLMGVGFTPIMGVFYATLIAFGVSFFRPETALKPKKLIAALRSGSMGVLGVAATCASAGIIVGVVTLTGLGLKFSSIVIGYAGGNLFLTCVFTGILMWIIGLAVPVTASYIIGAVIAAPALIMLKVPDYAAHMFIFYYAVLSEVSPPTALSPFAAAALTGGNPFKTTMMAWKYTLPAFIVPFMFTLHPDGVGLLLVGSWPNILWTSFTSMIGIAALAGGVDAWFLKRANWLERILLMTGGLMLVYSSWLYDAIGMGLVIAVIVLQKSRSDPLPA